MLSSLILRTPPETTAETSQTWMLQLRSRTIFLNLTAPFCETEAWSILLGLVKAEEVPFKAFQSPVTYGPVTFEKEDALWILSRLSGIKNPDEKSILPFIYTRLSTGFLSVTQAPDQLTTEQLADFVLYSLSHRLLSYQMLLILFDFLKSSVLVSSLVSPRVYQDFLTETAPFQESLPQDPAFRTLTLFIAGYHYQDFLREKKILPSLEDFLTQLQNQQLQTYFEHHRLNQIVRKQVEPKKILSFLAKIPDSTLARAFDALEWENFKGVISTRAYENVLDDIWAVYRKEDAFFYQKEVLEALVAYQIKENPPYAFLNQGHRLKQTLNLVFDKTGPVYSAIYFKSHEEATPLLAFFTGLRKQFVESLKKNEIHKRGGISQREQKTALSRFQYFMAAALLFPDLWFIFRFKEF